MRLDIPDVSLNQQYGASTPREAVVANYKATFIFNQGRAGWSEVMYFTKNDIDAALVSAANVADKRAGLMSTETVLEAVRVSDEGITGDSLIKFVNLNGPIANKSDEGPGDVSAVGWLARLGAGALYRRAYWLRGLPDTYVKYTSDRKPIIDGNLLSGFNAWKASVIANGGAMRVISKLDSDRHTRLVNYVISDTIDATLTRVGTQTAHPFVAGDTVYVARVKMIPTVIYPIPFPVNGLHRVLATETTLSMQLNLRWRAGWVYQSGGTVYKVVYTYPTIDTFNLERPGKRNTGRAFFVPAGRRSVR